MVFLCLLVVLLVSTTAKVPYQSHPTIQYDTGVLLSSPRLAFQPNPEGKSTLIRYNIARPETYNQSIEALEKKLSDYTNRKRWYALQSGRLKDCSAYKKYRPQQLLDEVCHFSINDLGPACTKQAGYGYVDGQPCVLFNLERIYKWLPVPYDNSSVPASIQNLWSKYYITLKCEGADAPSRDHIGRLRYYPTNGFAFKYFPYTGQPAWLPPLVFVQFESISPAVLVRVVCKVYADNIIHGHNLETGMVSFEVLVD